MILNCQNGRLFAWATSSAWRKDDFARWNWPWKLTINTSMKNKVSVLHVPVTTLWGNVPVNSKTANDPLQWGGPHFESNFPLYGAKLQWHAWGMPREGECELGSFGIDWYIKKRRKMLFIEFLEFESLLNLQISDFVTNNQWVLKKTKKRVQNWKCLGFCATRQF